jgi:hypothetical protein
LRPSRVLKKESAREQEKPLEKKRERRKTTLKFNLATCIILALILAVMVSLTSTSASSAVEISVQSYSSGTFQVTPDPCRCYRGDILTLYVHDEVKTYNPAVLSVKFIFPSPNPWSPTVTQTFVIDYVGPPTPIFGSAQPTPIVTYPGTYKYTVELHDAKGGLGNIVASKDPTLQVLAPVGGFVIPVDKLGLLAPYIGLASTITVATAVVAVCIKRVRRRKEKQ